MRLDAGRVDTVFKVPVGDRVLLRTKELLDAADIMWQAAAAVGWPLHRHGLPVPKPQRLHSPSRGGCSAARQLTSTGSSPSTSGLTTHDAAPPPAAR